MSEALEPEESAGERAVRQYLGEMGNDFSANKFVIVAEAFDKDGERRVYISNSKDMTAWDKIGLLRFALALEENNLYGGCDSECE